MDRFFCFHCMNPIDAPQAVCPLCGHDNQHRDNGPGMLSPTILEGRYLVGRVLGRGGFGVTYIGYDLQQERRIAIKEYFPAHLVMRGKDDLTISALTGSETDYEHGCRRALKESQVAARMGQIHGVVQVYNVFAANNTVYIIMEYVEGDTLSEHIEKHPCLSVADAIELLSPVARALNTLHKRDVIHRDVKPDNIMVHSQSGQGVLLDFGAARIADNSTISHSAAVVSQGYAPIEQYNLSSMDGRIDQYALAATLFHMLSGQRPPDVLQRVAQSNCMPSLQSLNPSVHAATEKVVLKGMALKAEDRYKDMASFWDALKASVNIRDERKGFSLKKAVALGTAIAVAGIALGYFVPRTSLWQNLFQQQTAQVSASGGEAEHPAETDAPIAADEPTVTDEPSGRGQTGTDDQASNSGSSSETHKPVPTDESASASSNPLPVPRISRSIKAFGATTTANLPLYSKSDAASEQVLTLAAPGEVVYVFHTLVVNKEGDEWAKVVCQGQNCYLPAQYITLPEYKTEGDYTYMTVGQRQVVIQYHDSDSVVAIPETFEGLPVTAIVSNAFQDCPVRELTIPATVTSIAQDAFVGTKQLVLVVEEDSAAEAFAEANGFAHFDPDWFNYTSRQDGAAALKQYQYGYDGDTACLGLPASYDGKPVTHAQSKLFYQNGIIRSVTLPDTMTQVASEMFRQSVVEEVFLPDSLTHIGESAFRECKRLAEITLPSQLTEIDRKAFHQCTALTKITLPEGLTTLGEEAFSGCTSLQRIHLPASLTSIGKNAFLKTSDDLLITVVSGSEGEAYAKKNGLNYVCVDAPAPTDDPSHPAALCGTWMLEMDLGESSNLNPADFMDLTGAMMTLTLNQDGTCITSFFGSDNAGTWSVEGNQILIPHENGMDVYLILDEQTIELQPNPIVTQTATSYRLVKVKDAVSEPDTGSEGDSSTGSSKPSTNTSKPSNGGSSPNGSNESSHTQNSSQSAPTAPSGGSSGGSSKPTAAPAPQATAAPAPQATAAPAPQVTAAPAPQVTAAPAPQATAAPAPQATAAPAPQVTAAPAPPPAPAPEPECPPLPDVDQNDDVIIESTPVMPNPPSSEIVTGPSDVGITID